MAYSTILIIAILIFLAYLYWRFFYFFRDPERKIPGGKNIVAPADGEIVYVSKVRKNATPLSAKKGKMLTLTEIAKSRLFPGEKFIVGIFINPFNVHVNRAPIEGKIEKIHYYKAEDLPMTRMWLRTMFSIKPFYIGSKHIARNERNTIIIKGKFIVAVVQIADIYVKRILCYVKKGDTVEKGQRIGMIRMGSQVDLIFPAKKNFKILVKEGDKVKAGESVIAELN